MNHKTTLHDTHGASGGRMVPFGGWDMPLHYGSQIEEHHAVRREAGLFDVSHMTILDLLGEQAQAFLRQLLANDVAKLRQPGKALYGCMLREDGGVIDDLIVYLLGQGRYRLVLNAATRAKDLAWIASRAAPFVLDLTSMGRAEPPRNMKVISPLIVPSPQPSPKMGEGAIERFATFTVMPRDDLDMIAVQGPKARARVLPLLPQDCRETAANLAPFNALEHDGWLIARTGYTGEDGFEIMLPQAETLAFWQALRQAGIAPCGLGARDTLRLEAGMPLYGTDMDEGVSPLESGLGWTVAWTPEERRFIGRAALETLRTRPDLRRFTGLLLESKGVLRNGLALYSGAQAVGEITSGGFSPTLERSIAMARVAAFAPEQLEVDLRGRRLPVRQVPLPFVRNGMALIDL